MVTDEASKWADRFLTVRLDYYMITMITTWLHYYYIGVLRVKYI